MCICSSPAWPLQRWPSTRTPNVAAAVGAEVAACVAVAEAEAFAAEVCRVEARDRA